MSDPNSLGPKKTNKDKKRSKQLFLPARDRRMMAKYQAGVYKATFQDALYMKNKGEEIFDPLYLENVDDRANIGDTYHVKIFVHLEPQSGEFTSEGMIKERKAQIDFSLEYLKERKIPYPTLGDMVLIEKELYRVLGIVKRDYFDHTFTPLVYAVVASKVRPSSINNYEDIIDQEIPKSPLLLPEKDANFIARQFASYHERAFSKITFIDRNFDSTDFDSFYMEDIEDWKVKGVRYEIPCYVRLNPNETRLKDIGVDVERDIEISMSKKLAEKYIPREKLYGSENASEFGNRFKYPNVGTVFLVEGEPYVVTFYHPEYYFGNIYRESDRNLGITLFGKKIRPSSFDPKERDFKEDEPEGTVKSGSIYD